MVAIYTNTQHIYTVTNKIFVKTFYEMWKKDKIFTARKNAPQTWLLYLITTSLSFIKSTSTSIYI